MEYRSGGTGGPHPGMDIFLDLSLRAKPYCGVKSAARDSTSLPLLLLGSKTVVPHPRKLTRE